MKERQPFAQDNLLGKSVELRALDDQAYEAIKEAILSFRLKPGMPLLEGQLARELHVSKTPVREALARLEQEGLVIRIPHTGTYVAEIYMEDIQDTFQVRALLEAFAVRLAVPTLTPEDLQRARSFIQAAEDALAKGDVNRCAEEGRRFHEIFLSKVDNRRLIELLKRLNGHIERVRMVTVRVPVSYRKSIEEHRAILAAAEHGNAEEAERATREHVTNMLHELKLNLSRLGGESLPYRHRASTLSDEAGIDKQILQELAMTAEHV